MMQYDLFARQQAVPTAPIVFDEPPPPDFDARMAVVNRVGWVPYPVGNRALSTLSKMIETPRSHRPPCLLIHGDSNAGKTTIAVKFAKDQNSRAFEASDQAIKPVLFVQNPPFADLGALVNRVLGDLGAPTLKSARLDRRLEQMLTLMQNAGVRMLIIDEIHNILPGKVDQRAIFMNGLKFLSNQLQIPIVLIGTIEALRATQSDPQLGNRFLPLAVPRWKCDEEYARFLAGLGQSMGVREGGSWRSRHFVTRFHTMTEGLSGETWKLMTLAVETAVRSRRERIDEPTLDATEWVRPSERRRCV